jgi:hypothetical protein
MTEVAETAARDAPGMPSWSTADVQDEQAPSAPASIRSCAPLERVRRLLRELFEQPAGEDDYAVSASRR